MRAAPVNTFPTELADEAIYILRETAAQFERPAILFSGGKDSIVVTHLAVRAFAPAPVPFPLLHVDTGHNFVETLVYRDHLVSQLGLELVVRYVQDSIDKGRVTEERGKYASRNVLQRPELFDMLNGRIAPGQNVRVFPISNWTELDVWQYIREEGLALPSIYFSHERDVFDRDGLLWADSPFINKTPDEQPYRTHVRFRTVGDMTCTAAVSSRAATLDAVIDEIASSEISERGARIDDKRSEAAMEQRKREGYF